jgi:putative ABC transport system substrate-binding protein
MTGPRRSATLQRDRRHLLAAAACLAVVPSASRAQRSRRPVRVGWIGWTGGAGAVSSPLPLEAFRSGLAEQGWREGSSLILEASAGDGPAAREMAMQMLRSGVDVIVAQGPMVFGARAVAGTVPIVFNINGDPIEAGLVTSLSRPDGNLTGVTALSGELAGKRLELIKETVPSLVRVAVLANQSHPGVDTERRALQEAAQKLGLTLAWFPVYGAADFGPAFEAIVRDRSEAVVAVPDNLINQQSRRIAEFAARRHLPTISGWAEFAEAGNLMSYGPNLSAYYRRVAFYVDRLLKGAKPAELPIEQPSEFELVVNLGVAATLRVAVPQSVLLRAHRTLG